MVPAPPDMTSPAFWQGQTPETLRTAILRGVPGTAMPGYEGTLDPEELAALVSYIEGFRHGAPAGAR
jgi:mono/diheme cytochrome c family protein